MEQTCLEEGTDLFRVTTNLILFRETGVLDRELNLVSIPYMGSPEGLRHCFEDECLATQCSTLASTRALLFHIISAKPSKQPCMVGSTLGV